MAQMTWTFEAVESHVAKVRVAALKARVVRAKLGAAAFRADPGSPLSELCEVWTAVRPIVVWLSNLSLIPPKWRELLKILLGRIGLHCAPGQRTRHVRLLRDDRAAPETATAAIDSLE